MSLDGALARGELLGSDSIGKSLCSCCNLYWDIPHQRPPTAGNNVVM